MDCIYYTHNDLARMLRMPYWNNDCRMYRSLKILFYTEDVKMNPHGRRYVKPIMISYINSNGQLKRVTNINYNVYIPHYFIKIFKANRLINERSPGSIYNYYYVIDVIDCSTRSYMPRGTLKDTFAFPTAVGPLSEIVDKEDLEIVSKLRPCAQSLLHPKHVWILI